jgi:hypothetical protein
MIAFSDKENEVFRVLVKWNHLPEDGTFLVTEDLISNYRHIYDQRFLLNRDVKTPSALRYRRKLAAVSLMKLNREREKIGKQIEVKTKLKSGFVYVISNPMFDGFYKVGFTRDVNARLSTYQTYDPNRGFMLEFSKFFSNGREKEKEVLNKFADAVHSGEWVRASKEQLISALE